MPQSPRIAYWSRTLIPTLRETPGDAVVPSHQWMLRAGLIRRLGSGLYSYLPLGVRSLRKAEQIVREEMDAAGALEVDLPKMQPIELWEKTGRRAGYGDNLFVVKDRHGNEQALAPTAEEVITTLFAGQVESYKDVPVNLYQIATKFRDEFRPRFGVLRSREFLMKDAYSFHLYLTETEAQAAGVPGTSLQAEYDRMHAAYCRVFDRCGVPYRVVEATAGEIGGDASHEFMVPSPTGEDIILESTTTDPDTGRPRYAANVEKAQTGPRGNPEDLLADPVADLETVHTPDCPGIDDVVVFFKKQLKSKLKAENMLKTLVCRATRRDGSACWVLGVVRGDHDLNEVKLKQAGDFAGLELADEREARDAGFVIGFVGPQIAATRPELAGQLVIVADPDAAKGGFWVTGANEVDHHVKGFNWRRDVPGHEGVVVADIRNAVEGDPAPTADGATLKATHGIELGHIFQLGSKYSKALDAAVLDEKNERQHVAMGCYGIGINRILAAAIERRTTLADGREVLGCDDAGIRWPVALAPYHVLIVPITKAPRGEGDVWAAVDQLANALTTRPLPGAAACAISTCLEVLIDDRDERPGVKFNDADLIGIPVRIVVGEKGLAQGEVEIKARDGSTGDAQSRFAQSVALDAAADRVAELIAAMCG